MSEPERCLGESDWEDIDLLTNDEATHRLDQDIAVLRDALAEHPADAQLSNRLALLRDARVRLAGRRTFDFPKA
jgi:hypothetical protein